ncbi:MAG: hypothetical protein ACJ8AJ_07630 [Gemmatimonadaceae bacterium]
MKSMRSQRHPSLSPSVVVLSMLVLAAACSQTSSADRALLRADAELFENVVQSQLARTAADSNIPPGFLRVDARPAGDNTVLAATPDRVGVLDLVQSADTLSPRGLARIAEQRKGILEFLRVEQGGPFMYPDCGGTRTRRLKDTAAVGLRPECPAALRRYVTIGLPYRGAAAALEEKRNSVSPPLDSTAEYWTVLVSESTVGPTGQDWRQYAWLFKRDPETNRLAVTEKFLLSWAE